MSKLEEFKAAYMAAADDRWEHAILGARRLLTYDRARDYPGQFLSPGDANSDALVRKLARMFFTVREHNLWEALGGVECGFGVKMNGYGSRIPYDTCARLEFLGWFIGHELLDDGTPGIAYYRGTYMDKPRPRETFVRCSKNHPYAQPYFHRDIDLLREEGYDPPEECVLLCVDSAIEVLESLEKASEEKSLRRRGDAERRTDYENRLAALADELIAMGPAPWR